MKPSIKTLITEAALRARVEQLGTEISQRYQQSDALVLVGLLRGCFIFMADLCRQIEPVHEVDFMIASSYGNNTHSSRDVRLLKDLEGDIAGKDVLIVEDIIDSGYTLSKVREMLLLRSPQSLSICTLLDKPSRREVAVSVEWVGFTLPDAFVVGYGIDYAQQYRHLPFIGSLNLSA